MQSFSQYFRTKTVFFYLACAAALLSILAGIIYGASYSGTVYLNAWAVVLPIIAGVSFAAMAVFDITRPYATVLMTALDFIGFLVFVDATYIYLSEVFFGGITAEAFGNLKASYVFVVIFLLLSVILSNICIYAKPDKPAAENSGDEDIAQRPEESVQQPEDCERELGAEADAAQNSEDMTAAGENTEGENV